MGSKRATKRSQEKKNGHKKTHLRCPCCKPSPKGINRRYDKAIPAWQPPICAFMVLGHKYDPMDDILVAKDLDPPVTTTAEFLNREPVVIIIEVDASDYEVCFQ